MELTLKDLRYGKRISATHCLADALVDFYKVDGSTVYYEIGGGWYDVYKGDVPNFIDRLTAIDYSPLDDIPDQPTHAVLFQCERGTDTLLAYTINGELISFNGGWSLNNVGEIIKVWELN